MTVLLRFLVVGGGIALAALSGCATYMNDSVRSPRPGYSYVVGAWEDDPVVWLCPDEPRHGGCEEVDVED
ncbi:MAG: hypothetical protein HY905_14710 [Deltaproteobacteria bacterium]|nr:hypothetical protein [Deltaproteobacteria bacterium]